MPSLEDGLHRPIVDETGMIGIYDFKTKGQARTTEEFLAMMRDQIGLLLTPTQRSIEMIVVRLRNPVEGDHDSGAKPIRIPAGSRSPIPERSRSVIPG